MDKPRVFIASSSKALIYATAVQSIISEGDHCDCYVWKDVPSYPAKTITELILKIAERFDFGVFIFSNDDNITINDQQFVITRDNVLFELGLFSGRLGFEQCFVLRPNVANFRLPSDLEGILDGRFNIPKDEDLIESALRPACTKILKEIRARWKILSDQKKKESTPERIAAICYRKNQKNLYEFLLVRSSNDSHSRRGFPKKPFNNNEKRQPIDVAIEVAKEEGAVKVRKVEKAPEFQPFRYKKESDKDKVVNYTPFLLEVEDVLQIKSEFAYRDPQFFTLGEVFNELRSNREDSQSIRSLERVICQCYDFLLKE